MSCCYSFIWVAKKRVPRLLGQLARESGAQVIFSSLLLVVGTNTERSRQAQSTNTWLCGSVAHHSFGLTSTAPGQQVSDGIHLSDGGRAHKLEVLLGRALN